MRGRMQGLWADVLAAEEGIGKGEPGALDSFTYSAGTMIETYRLARGNFGKNRVSCLVLRNDRETDADGAGRHEDRQAAQGEQE
jgi:general transcription factor 3C polypeptide 3 (transcription factor C subunit 4)